MFNIHSGHIALAVLLTSYIATLAETAKIHCLSPWSVLYSLVLFMLTLRKTLVV